MQALWVTLCPSSAQWEPWSRRHVSAGVICLSFGWWSLAATSEQLLSSADLMRDSLHSHYDIIPPNIRGMIDALSPVRLVSPPLFLRLPLGYRWGVIKSPGC